MNDLERREAEIRRIKQEYERRNHSISPHFYSSTAGNAYMYRQRKRDVVRLLRETGVLPLAGKQILEIGCGDGVWLGDFIEWGASETNLHGLDLMEARLNRARESFPLADLRSGDASRLPWEDGQFDLVLQSTVFTSILDMEYKHAAAAEMRRVLKNTGAVLWYDFIYSNPHNPHVKGIPISEVRMYFAGCPLTSKKVTLAPPLARSLAPYSVALCRLLEGAGFLNTHLLAVIRPAGTSFMRERTDN